VWGNKVVLEPGPGVDGDLILGEHMLGSRPEDAPFLEIAPEPSSRIVSAVDVGEATASETATIDTGLAWDFSLRPMFISPPPPGLHHTALSSDEIEELCRYHLVGIQRIFVDQMFYSLFSGRDSRTIAYHQNRIAHIMGFLPAGRLEELVHETFDGFIGLEQNRGLDETELICQSGEVA